MGYLREILTSPKEVRLEWFCFTYKRGWLIKGDEETETFDLDGAAGLGLFLTERERTQEFDADHNLELLKSSINNTNNTLDSNTLAYLKTQESRNDNDDDLEA